MLTESSDAFFSSNSRRPAIGSFVHSSSSSLNARSIVVGTGKAALTKNKTNPQHNIQKEKIIKPKNRGGNKVQNEQSGVTTVEKKEGKLKNEQINTPPARRSNHEEYIVRRCSPEEQKTEQDTKQRLAKSIKRYPYLRT